MEHFRLEHPPDRLILCNRSQCEGIADYLEVNEHGGEDLVCAAHTSSERHASVCRSAFMLNRTGADLLPSPAPHRYD